MNKLKRITTEAKKLYKTGKYQKWTDAIKAASKKIGATSTHKDTKSHNVNIRVVSGVKKKIGEYFGDGKIVTLFQLKPGKTYEWIAGAEYITATYLGRTKEFPNIKPGSKVGINANLLFQLSTGSYVALSATALKNYLRTIPDTLNGWKKGNTAMIEVGEKKIRGKKNVRVVRTPKNSFLKPGTFSRFATLGSLFDTSIINDIDSLKKEYFKLAKKYHPDAGGTTAQFQQLQSEYEKLLKNLLNGSTLNKEQQNNEMELDAALREVLNQIIPIPGINIELIGKWLWVTGNTYPVRKELQKAGLIFFKKEGVPYWVYKGVESAGRGKMTIEEIKQRYGTKKFNTGGGSKLISGVNVKIKNRTKLLAALKKVVKALNKRPL